MSCVSNAATGETACSYAMTTVEYVVWAAAIVGAVLWMFTVYRVMRLPWLRHRYILLGICWFALLPLNWHGWHGFIPVLFPGVLLWTYLKPGQKPDPATWAA